MAKRGGRAKGLTKQEAKFVEHFLDNHNGAEAYGWAYPASLKQSAAYRAKKANALFNKGYIAAIIEARSEKRIEIAEKKFEITVDKVIRELALIGFSNMLDYISVQEGDAFVDLSKLTRDQAAAIGELTSETYLEGKGDDAKTVKRTKFKLSDKRSALVDLGKHLGMFPTRINGTINHEHHHSAEPVSESAEWLAKLLGGGADSQAPQPLPH